MTNDLNARGDVDQSDDIVLARTGNFETLRASLEQRGAVGPVNEEFEFESEVTVDTGESGGPPGRRRMRYERRVNKKTSP